ncbi:phosphonoacetaldehyde reductase [Pirellulaceae bacterium SH449]
MSKLILKPGGVSELRQAINSITNPQSSSRDAPLRLMAIIDQNAYENSGAKTILEPVLDRYSTLRFSGFQPNPKWEDVSRGIELYRQQPPDILLSIGGGTAIDLAKLISSLALAPNAESIIRGRSAIPIRTTKLIAIPTTAGTGSESTQFAVVYLGPQKYSLDHPSLLPDLALVDPNLMSNLPWSITAATGLDALCQAIESVWSVAANDRSIELACEAISIAIQNLKKAVVSPNPALRLAMCRASNLAGQAINMTRTTACHALSYWITSQYGVSHGVAVALTLPAMLEFNSQVAETDCNDPRGPTAVRERIERILKSMQSKSIDEACSKFRHLQRQIGCPTSIAEIGITSPDEINQIVQSVNLERLSNNPRKASSSVLNDLLSQ